MVLTFIPRSSQKTIRSFFLPARTEQTLNRKHCRSTALPVELTITQEEINNRKKKQLPSYKKCGLVPWRIRSRNTPGPQQGIAKPGACVDGIEYHSDQSLDKMKVILFAVCTYFAEHHNILLLGVTGISKAYPTCALCMAVVQNSLAASISSYQSLPLQGSVSPSLRWSYSS